MLHEFLTANRIELIERCRSGVEQRTEPGATPVDLEHGVPLFLDQLITTLQMDQMSGMAHASMDSGPESGQQDFSEIERSATLHGRELLQQGFTVDQLVHGYGDLCQAVTGLAFDVGETIEAEEFKTFNLCLDYAIAGAVTEFSSRRDSLIMDKGEHALNERLGILAHELRNHLNTAMLAIAAIKAGNVGLTGATGAVLDRSLIGLRDLIDRSLAEVRINTGIPAQRQRFLLAGFIAEVRISASLEARARGCKLSVSEGESGLALNADRDMLFSEVGNLLQNAFKFTHRGTEVSLTAYAAGDRIRIDIADHCGGLPPGAPEKMFQPFTQGSVDKSGLGLGLSISRRSVEANGGTLSVRDVPGSGCVFTIDLPRHSLP